MKARRVANPIAVRRLVVLGHSGHVTVTIGKPRTSRKFPGEWVCVFLVEGIGGTHVQPAYGADALSALQNALTGARWALDNTGATFTWEAGELGDTGIARHVPSHFGLRFARRVERYIDRGIDRLGALGKARTGEPKRARRLARQLAREQASPRGSTSPATDVDVEKPT